MHCFSWGPGSVSAEPFPQASSTFCSGSHFLFLGFQCLTHYPASTSLCRVDIIIYLCADSHAHWGSTISLELCWGPPPPHRDTQLSPFYAWDHHSKMHIVRLTELEWVLESMASQCHMTDGSGGHPLRTRELGWFSSRSEQTTAASQYCRQPIPSEWQAYKQETWVLAVVWESSFGTLWEDQESTSTKTCRMGFRVLNENPGVQNGVLLKNCSWQQDLVTIEHNKAPQTVFKTTAILYSAPGSVGWLGSSSQLSTGNISRPCIHCSWHLVTLEVSSLTHQAPGLGRLRQLTAETPLLLDVVPLHGTCRMAILGEESSQTDYPKRNQQRLPFCFNLTLEVTQCHLHCILFTQRPQRPTQMKG